MEEEVCSTKVGLWRRLTGPASRALALMSSSSPSSPSPSDACHIPSSPPSLKGQPPDEVEEVNTGVLTSQGPVRSQRLPRTVPPFIASHDVPRGALFALQSLLFYILMLAVMCVPISPP